MTLTETFNLGCDIDHTAILCKLDVSVPVQKPETFLYWCLKKIDTGAFKQDLSHAVSQVSSIGDYNNHLCSVLDKHAPLCRCTVRTRKLTPWFSSIAEQFCELKRERRQAERRWLKSKLTIHEQIYNSIKQIVTNLVDKAKQAYYSAKIQSSTTCKQLFQNFNTILSKSRSSPLPLTFDSDNLPNVFSDNFTEKIHTIRNNFPPPNPTACPDTSFTGNPLLTFESVTDEFVLKIINQVLWTWSPSHHTSLWKHWHPLAVHYEHHQHISYHWHCTTWSEDSHHQTSVEKAISWQKPFEKLPSHF